MPNKCGRPKSYTIPQPYNYKYSRSKAQAKYHGHEWAFTDESWYEMWLESGKLEHMGTKVHQYCMVRLDEIEAWGPHNCIIITRRSHLKKQGYVNLRSYPDEPWLPRHAVNYKQGDTHE